MICEYCGAPMEGSSNLCARCGAVQARTPDPVTIPRTEPADPAPQPENAPDREKKSLHPALRVLLSLCTVLLCVILSVSLVATSLVMDLQRLTSENGLSAVVGDLLWERPRDLMPGRATASLGGIGDMLPETAPSELESPENLMDFVYDTLKEQYGDELKVTPEQVETFVEESSAKDFVSDKLVSYGNDLLTGQRSTTITNEEILDLIDDNLDLVEDTFGVTVDRTFRGQVVEFLDRNDINAMIRENVLDPVSTMEIPGLTPLLQSLNGISGTTATFADLMAQILVIASTQTLTALMILNVILVILLLLTNRLRVGPTLISAGVPALIVGVLLGLPVALIQLLPVLLGDSLGIAAIAVNLIGALAGRMAPVHYGMAIVGLVLIIAGAIVKAVTKKAKPE